jgi:hypothetical protein
MNELANLLDKASKQFELSRSFLDQILGLERASLYMESSRMSVRKKLRELIQESSTNENKKTRA